MKTSTMLALRPTVGLGIYFRLALCLVLLPALVCGCENNGGSESGSTAIEDMAETDEQANEDASPWVGRWLFTITEQTTDFHPFLLQIEERQGQRGLQIIDRAPRPEFKEWKLKGAAFKPDGMQLAIDTGNVTLIFEGTMYDDEVFLGVVHPEDTPLPTPARFVKYPETSLRGFETPQPTDGVEAFQKARQAEDTVAAMETFIKENKNSPLVEQAYETLIVEEIASKADPERIQTLKTEMEAATGRWGNQLKMESMFTLASLLVDEPNYREIQGNTLNELSEMLGNEAPEQIQLRWDMLKGKYLLNSESGEEQKAGEEMLLGLLESQPFDFNAILALAKYYELQNQPQKALALYAKLAVAPGMSRMVGNIADPQSGDEVSLLSKTRALFEGSDEKFDAFLDETYEEVAFYFLPEEKPETSLSANRRIPLLELFTGAMCPPCVAGDLAVGGVEQTFPAPEAIVVRYHQHIPGPDPLTNSVGENRFSYYGGRGTPALYINGDTWESVGGYLVHAERHYANLMPYVADLLSQPSYIKIDLNAKAEGESIAITAKASELSDSRTNLKLRLLLVEPLIHYEAPNGIRLHEMVVRDSPGGLAGKAAEGASVSVETSVNVAELKTKLEKQLSAFEENRGYTFETKPLDMNSFRVIAFIQDDSSKEILQSAISPVVTLSGQDKPAKEEAKPEAEKKPAAEEKPAADKAEKPAEKPAEKEEMKAEEKPAATPEAKPENTKSPAAADKPADSDKPAEAKTESNEPEAKAETETDSKPADSKPAEETENAN